MLHLNPDIPAIVLAPMEGLTDAPMRQLQGEIGAFTWAVSEFQRVAASVLPGKVFHRNIPELLTGARTRSGLPVHVQLLGGHPERMALSAFTAVGAGATAIDINFGCPAPTVNSHDGGATLLKHPRRIREIVAAVRGAVPREIPVSAKLRLGWDSAETILENAAMAAEGGANWLAIHGRTREQGYRPPALWHPLRAVRERTGIPVIANGDIWTIEDFRRCREETGCIHFMLGRGALANPRLSHQVAHELGLIRGVAPQPVGAGFDWRPHLERLIFCMDPGATTPHPGCVGRVKQWLKIASLYGHFPAFESIKRARSLDEIFTVLSALPG